jgi:molybdopterin synthase catalytic subunit
MVHRVGCVAIRETAVLVVVTAAHRAAAFRACQYLVDRLKSVVPIWKKEFYVDGAAWVEGDGQTNKPPALEGPGARRVASRTKGGNSGVDPPR